MKKIFVSMNQFINTKWPLILILTIAAVLRFWQLGSIPPSLTQDEASLGYNAYSILKTGRDEYGEFLPIIFKSFGDYKPGLYVYTAIPSIAVLGLNEFAVRFPSALAGVISVLLIYLIASLLFPKRHMLHAVTCFVAATNPWLIYFSRGAWEANLSLTLTLAGILFFLKSIQSNKYLVLSAMSFAMTLVTYQGAKLSTVIIVLVLAISYWKDLKILLSKKWVVISSVVVSLIIVLPILLSLFNGKTGRLGVFSIFSYPRPKEYTQAFLDEGGEKFGSITYYLFHSEILNFKRGIMGRWFNHFSAKFLFFDGDYQNPQHSSPYQGMLLLSDLFLLAAGLFFVIKNYSLFPKSYILILLWLLLAPLPAVLSRDQVQSVRAFNMAIPLIFIVSIGLTYLLEVVCKNRIRLLLYGVILFIFSASFIYFLDSYFVHVPKHNSSYWNYGYKEVVKTIIPIQENYKNVIIQQSFSQPYIYFLFYQKYNPREYQKQAQLVDSSNASDVGFVEKLGNVTFSQIDWSIIKNMRGSLIVIDGITSIPSDLSYNLIREIKYLNGRDTAFNIVEIQ